MVDASLKISTAILRDYYELQLLQHSKKSLDNFCDHLIRKIVPKLQEELLKARPNFLTNIDDNIDGDFWVFNVLEGEKNFLHALPYFTISIAHVNQYKTNKRVISGLVVVPALKEMFFAELDQGTWFERFEMQQGKPDKLQLSGRRTKSELVCATNVNALMDDIEYRNFGSNAIALSYLAAGRVDGVILEGCDYRDIAAGLLIAKKAGAVIETKNNNIFASTEYFKTQYNL
jgi:myo-inositol-1(or 4)-monophosphatase